MYHVSNVRLRLPEKDPGIYQEICMRQARCSVSSRKFIDPGLSSQFTTKGEKR